MMTLIKERMIFDVIIEVNKNGDTIQILCDKTGVKMANELPHRISNAELIFYDRNGYNVVRSDKKKCQEYTRW